MRRSIIALAGLIVATPSFAVTLTGTATTLTAAAASRIGGGAPVGASDVQSGVGSPLVLTANANAVATGQNGGSVSTFSSGASGLNAGGLSGFFSMANGWDFQAQPGEEGVSARFANGGDQSGWSYTFTPDEAVTLELRYSITGTGNTFGLQGFTLRVNDLFDGNLASGDFVEDPSGRGSLTFNLLGGVASTISLTTFGNISSASALDDYIGRQDGEFAFFITGGGGVVPEPATWAMMIGGFGLVGGALRTRRRMPAPAHRAA